VMDQCLKAWRQRTALWGRIGAHKATMTEPRESSALKACLADYDFTIQERGAAVLFAVCRGKVKRKLC